MGQQSAADVACCIVTCVDSCMMAVCVQTAVEAALCRNLFDML